MLRDWLPFALVLLLYDLSRGAATLLGAPTLWQFQPDADRWLFFGTVPTVWLQERMKLPQPPWWEVIISGIYMSFFVLPYVVAGVLWLRNRSDWAAFVRRFVALSFAALVVYIVHAGSAAVGGRTVHPGRHRRLARPTRTACTEAPQGFPTADCWARCTPACPALTSSLSGSPPAAGERCICSRPARWSTPDRPA